MKSSVVVPKSWQSWGTPQWRGSALRQLHQFKIAPAPRAEGNSSKAEFISPFYNISHLPPMTRRTIHLIASRNAEAQRAHFAIFVPSEKGPEQGTLIEAVGAPMAGYMLEFKRNYSPPNDSVENYEIIPIGEIDSANIVDDESGVKSADVDPRGDIEVVAAQIPTPGINENFLTPVNEVCLCHTATYAWVY